MRDVERRAHGRARKHELESALEHLDQQREAMELGEEELRALGVIVVLEGADARYPLRLDSLEQLSRHTLVAKRPKWLLLAVAPAAGDEPERAVVWVSDEYRAAFLRLFEQFLEEETEGGHARHRELVANIGRITDATLASLWQSAGAPPTSGDVWWELWLRPTGEELTHLQTYASARGLLLSRRVLRFDDRTVAWLRGSWDSLQALPFTAVPLAEIRRPEIADTVEDLERGDQEELVGDLVSRVAATADPDAPVICHLDTGVRRTHALLAQSIHENDVHSIVDEFGIDTRNHGTPMAGLALLGPLDDLVLGTDPVELRHRLESVKILYDGSQEHDPLTYGVATAAAVALPEAAAAGRRRVFCMPVTCEADNPGQPSLWSASIDALAAGTDIARADAGIELLGGPDADASRLFVISAGNVSPATMTADYRGICDVSPVEDPAHAWNALTVGAYTDLTHMPSDPGLAGWSPLAVEGDISPHSRTSLTFGSRVWPIKPDICMEGGNVLYDGTRDMHPSHPLLSLRTTDSRDDLAIASANATSAATAQAARLAALASATYPSYWPETIRGLLVHAANWTSTMRSEIDGATTKGAKLALLRRYGWGVPAEREVLTSTGQAVTMVVQDAFKPFEGPELAARAFRLHRLPWPVEVLEQLGAGDVELRVTLSYFVEPIASRRGWRRRYTYASHGLRFDLKAPTETVEQFVVRVNRAAEAEEDAGATRTGSAVADRWLIGPKQRNLGSLHQDVWEGSAADLANSGVLAVHPVGGWWKNNRRSDRVDREVRYALIVSLRTPDESIDLYTPVAVQLELPIEALVVAGS